MRRVAITGVAALAGRGLVVISWIFVVPLGLAYLGPERYGMWITATSLAAVAQFADFGIGYGFLNAATTALTRGDRQRLQTEVSTAAVVLVGGSAFVALLFLLGDAVVAWPDVFRVRDARAVAEARNTVLIAVAAFLVSQGLSFIPQFRFARQQGYLVHFGTGVAAVASVAAVVLAIQLDAGAPGLTAAISIPPIVATIAIGAVFNRDGLALPRPSVSAFSAPAAKALFRSGLMFFSIQAAMSLAFAADPLIVTQTRGPTAAAEYGVVARLFLIPLGVIGAFMAPLWPAYRDAMTRRDTAWILKTFRLSILLAVVIGSCVGGVLAILGSSLIDLWVNGSVKPQDSLILGFCVWIPLNALGTGCAVLLNGLGEVRTQAIFALAMAVLNVAATLALTSRFGAAGAIWGTIVSYVALVLIPMAIYVPRVVDRIQHDVAPDL